MVSKRKEKPNTKGIDATNWKISSEQYDKISDQIDNFVDKMDRNKLIRLISGSANYYVDIGNDKEKVNKAIDNQINTKILISMVVGGFWTMARRQILKDIPTVGVLFSHSRKDRGKIENILESCEHIMNKFEEISKFKGDSKYEELAKDYYNKNEKVRIMFDILNYKDFADPTLNLLGTLYEFNESNKEKRNKETSGFLRHGKSNKINKMELNKLLMDEFGRSIFFGDYKYGLMGYLQLAELIRSKEGIDEFVDAYHKIENDIKEKNRIRKDDDKKGGKA